MNERICCILGCSNKIGTRGAEGFCLKHWKRFLELEKNPGYSEIIYSNPVATIERVTPKKK